MNEDIKNELVKWVKDTYDPSECGYTEFRSSGNATDVFNDGYSCGMSIAAYEIGCILGMELEEQEEQDYNF